MDIPSVKTGQQLYNLWLDLDAIVITNRPDTTADHYCPNSQTPQKTLKPLKPPKTP